MATFGYSTIGGSFSSNGANFIQGNKYTLTEAGQVSKLSAYLKGNGVSSQVERVAIYADSAGAPGALKGVSAEINIAAGAVAAWVDFTLSVTLAAGDYWLCLWSGANGSGSAIAFDATAQDDFVSATYSSTGNPPDPFGTPTTTTRQMSLYATYTPTGATSGSASGGVNYPTAILIN